MSTLWLAARLGVSRMKPLAGWVWHLTKLRCTMHNGMTEYAYTVDIVDMIYIYISVGHGNGSITKVGMAPLKLAHPSPYEAKSCMKVTRRIKSNQTPL